LRDASCPLLAQPPRRRRAKARRAPHAVTTPVIGMASAGLNRTADNASNTVIVTATATLKARHASFPALLTITTEGVQRSAVPVAPIHNVSFSSKETVPYGGVRNRRCELTIRCSARSRFPLPGSADRRERCRLDVPANRRNRRQGLKRCSFNGVAQLAALCPLRHHCGAAALRPSAGPRSGAARPQRI
jgi:hypothetical protein